MLAVRWSLKFEVFTIGVYGHFWTRLISRHYRSTIIIAGVARYKCVNEKGKEGYLYSAILVCYTHKALRHGSYNFHLQITPCLPVLRKRSTDGATPNWGSRHPIAACYSLIDLEGMKGWVGLVGWVIAVTRKLQVERRTGKFADQRPTFYRCATKLPLLLWGLEALSLRWGGTITWLCHNYFV